MECSICRNGAVSSGLTTVTLDRDGATVIVRGVPAEICDACGEYYLTPEVSEELLRRAADAVRRGAEVEILRWVAA